MGITKPEIEQLLKENKHHQCKGGEVCVKTVAVADLPTRFGDFQIIAFYNNQDKKEHIALIHGDVCGKENVPVRIHSECLTGDAIGSLRCDCRDQLQQSLKQIAKMKNGVLFYLRQEGRGIGLINKIKAYQLQDNGFDTIEANKALGFKPDERDYDVAAHMLRSLNIKSIKLMTNNPHKINGLQKHRIKITGRIPLIVKANKHNKFYLETKRKKAGHLIEGLEQED